MIVLASMDECTTDVIAVAATMIISSSMYHAYNWRTFLGSGIKIHPAPYCDQKSAVSDPEVKVSIPKKAF